MATPEANVSVGIGVEAQPVVPNVKWGPASWLGLILTILPIIGSVVAAIEGNDTATVTAGVGAILVALTTIGGRMAQAIAAARSAATIAGPWIDALQTALATTPPGQRASTVVVNAAPVADTATVEVNDDPGYDEPEHNDYEEATESLEDREVEEITDDELPSDEEEFDAGPPLPDSAVHPDVPR
jgi:hypothetical protein